METKDNIYVMELKFGKSAQEALEQIKAKHYAKTFAMKGKHIVMVGMNFTLVDGISTLDYIIA